MSYCKYIKFYSSFVQEDKECYHSIPFGCLFLCLFTNPSTNDDVLPLEKKENGQEKVYNYLLLLLHLLASCVTLNRMKKKVERKKRRIMLRKRAALAAMKGMMVAEIGTGRQVDGGLEATFAQMKGPRGAAPKLPKKLGKYNVSTLC